jgi:hypothetical protein
MSPTGSTYSWASRPSGGMINTSNLSVEPDQAHYEPVGMANLRSEG